MTILSEVNGTLKDKLLIFFNEYIIGSRPAKQILADLRIMYHTSGKIVKKLKALLLTRINKSTRDAIAHLLSIARTNNRRYYRRQRYHFTRLLDSYIKVMDQQIRYLPNLSGL